MTAAELAAKIAERFDCVQGFFRAHSQTGERYVIFAERGGPDDEAECCARMLKSFDAYAAKWDEDHKGESRPTLYWRYAPPHVHWYADDDNKRRMFAAALYCRLVLSNLPVVNETDEEYDAKRTKQLEQEIAHGQPKRQQLEPSDQEQRDGADQAASPHGIG